MRQGPLHPRRSPPQFGLAALKPCSRVRAVAGAGRPGDQPFSQGQGPKPSGSALLARTSPAAVLTVTGIRTAPLTAATTPLGQLPDRAAGHLRRPLRAILCAPGAHVDVRSGRPPAASGPAAPASGHRRLTVIKFCTAIGAGFAS